MSATITGIEKIPYEMDGRTGYSYFLVISFGGLEFKVKVQPKGVESIIELLLKQFEGAKENKKS